MGLCAAAGGGGASGFDSLHRKWDTHRDEMGANKRVGEKWFHTARSNKRKVDSENKAYSRRRYVDGSSSKLHLASEKKTTI